MPPIAEVWIDKITTGKHVTTRRVEVNLESGAVTIYAYSIGPRGGLEPYTAVGFTREEWEDITARIDGAMASYRNANAQA